MLAPGQHIYSLDTLASGFYGQSDDFVLRVEAFPSYNPGNKGVAGPYQRPYLSAQTFPFRVRGTQIRVLSNTVPISNAIVYRLPFDHIEGAEPYADPSGMPFRTDGQGYLQGRGQIAIGDRLVALLPITSTDSYTLYFSSAVPTGTGLGAYTVTASGVQILAVTSNNPLVVFNLDVSLEWDARADTQFMAKLEHDLSNTSDYLYDWTNGQAALGHINIYFDREKWDDAHVQIYATNRLRPNAQQGGIVSDVYTDPVTSTITYDPGQVRIGAVWNRYGESNGNLGEDWPRALAHELSHFALFLDDDYLGLDANGRLISVDACTGTAMSDPYREDYSEFHFQDRWLTDCANTLANKETGRWDWATITTFYPWLNGTMTNTGPSVLPLAVAQINFVEPITPSTVLAAPIFNLTQNGVKVQPGPGARAYLFQQTGRLIDLGNPTLDQVEARGARLGDRLCVYEPSVQRLGCETISAGDEELALISHPDWQPDIRVTPVNSRTLSLSVSANGLPATTTLQARLYTFGGMASPIIVLSDTFGSPYTGTFTVTDTLSDGYVQVWIDEGEPRRESMIDYALGGSPAYRHGRGAYRHGRGAYRHGRGAPVESADGQVVLFADGVFFGDEEFYALQAISKPPTSLPGRMLVGQAYRLMKSANAPNLASASLSFYYAGRDVPVGEETFLRVYFNDGTTWQALPTTVDANHNVAVASIPTMAGGVGIYALMSSIEIPLYGLGWDQFSYPVQVTQSVTDALQSISGYYSIVYWYDGSDVNDHWKVYAPGVPGYVNDLSTLRFAESYWISLTQSITLSLSGGQLPNQPVTIQSPPATYYGAVSPSSGFTPSTGLIVKAWIGGNMCGQGITQNVGGDIVYSLNVVADGPGGTVGCGAPGRIVSFTVSDRPMNSHVSWNNAAVWKVDLAAAYYIYLPLIKKG